MLDYLLLWKKVQMESTTYQRVGFRQPSGGLNQTDTSTHPVYGFFLSSRLAVQGRFEWQVVFSGWRVNLAAILRQIF